MPPKESYLRNLLTVAVFFCERFMPVVFILDFVTLPSGLAGLPERRAALSRELLNFWFFLFFSISALVAFLPVIVLYGANGRFKLVAPYRRVV
ncbi:hypothetical protein CENSYa_1259 [Cenarchaeum symbiosum A]|uniref:Uncharacterized protein n=1 Tax=Cenarchaeum symbiosum (strain A) TaxID=414004 RepID=A0RX15_CENSY|nr:hypothetical protein CENSYa_1259 [Cenarchaeum symbiosum A]